jgi:hypothetical protein
MGGSAAVTVGGTARRMRTGKRCSAAKIISQGRPGIGEFLVRSWGQESRTPTRFCLGRLAWRTGSAICPPINGEPQLVCNDFGNRIPYDDYLRAFSQIRPAAMADRGPEP